MKEYTDEQLYAILDVSPGVTDRELEAKIIENIRKYGETKEIRAFFTRVYDHFFIPEEEEDTNQEPRTIIEGLENMGTATKKKDATEKEEKKEDTPALSTNLSYVKDKLNPLLNQTIKKIISVDSQYRDPNYAFSTQFTFDLNDPLRDVVSLKLYSVQIPYSWYTISNDFGSNFFFLKAQSPGINTGAFDYQIQILSGNYTAQQLIQTINTSLQSLQTTYPSVNFGTTGITYNPYTGLSQLTIDLQNRFNDYSYRAFLPNTYGANAGTLAPPYTSLPDYLGFDLSTNTTTSTYLTLQQLFSDTIQTSTSDDTYDSIYQIDAFNNSFQIILYTSSIVPAPANTAYYTTTTYNDPLSTTVETITITLALNPGAYTRNAIEAALNLALQTNTQTNQSNITKTPPPPPTEITTDIIIYNFLLSITLAKQATQTAANNKIALVFPTEPPNQYAFPLWTGPNSCFEFPSTVIEMSETTAADPLLQTNYVITQSPTLFLQCDLSGYNNASNNIPITVANSPDPINGYNFNAYIAAINAAFQSASQTNPSLSSISGIILDPTSTPTLYLDVNNIYTTPNYNVDFTNSVLNNVFAMTYSPGQLSGSLSTTQSFTGTLPISAAYYVPKTLPLVTFAGGIAALQNIDPYVVPFIATNYYEDPPGNFYIYNDHNKIAIDMNASFLQFQESAAAGGAFTLTATLVAYSGTITGNQFSLTLSVTIKKVINQTQYSLLLYDVSGSQTIVAPDSTWFRNLNFQDPSYNLATQPRAPGSSASIVVASTPVSANSIYIAQGINDTFFLEPLPNATGLTTTTPSPDFSTYYSTETGFQNSYPYNYIRITIPSNQTYSTYLQVIEAINTALSNNAKTKGSYVSTIQENGATYVKIRWNINAVFTAADYTIDFYDNVSFVKCYVGDSSVRNTTWDTTLGWIIGFQKQQQYTLSAYTTSTNPIATLQGEVAVNTNLYNYLLISLDDFNQNRLNDGVVVITKNEIKIPLPSYSSQAIISCDANGNQVANPSTNVAENNLTLNQIYSLNQILNAQQNVEQNYTTGPFVKDIFGTIPLKVNGLQPSQSYVEFGGTLQQQERLYFGPVNIHRMSITLYTDKGTVLDLNGVNWSFSFVAEQLYQKQKI